jgi:hypothetical protein
MSFVSKQFVPISHKKLMRAYGKWVRQHVDKGWEAFFLTFMFSQIPGPPNTRIALMQDEIMRVYATLATRVVRKPNSPHWFRYLPKGIFVPDRPVYKPRKSALRDVSVNDGLHMHGIMVARRRIGCVTPRMRESLDHHFIRNMHRYLNDRLIRIDIEPITHRPKYVTGYAMKALKRSSFDFDQVLILPRTLSELPS